MNASLYTQLLNRGQSQITFQGTNVQVFFLPASYEQLEAITNATLNAAVNRNYLYRPLLPFVLCNPVWIDQIGGLGITRESNIGFGYLVGAFVDEILLDHVAVAVPLVYTDAESKWQFEYVAGTYQPGAVREDGKLITAILPPPAWGRATRKATDADLRQIAALVSGDLALDASVVIERILEFLHRQVVTLVLTALDRVVEVEVQITNLHSAWFLAPDHRVAVSAPIASELGITADGGIVDAKIGFQSYFDGQVSHP